MLAQFIVDTSFEPVSCAGAFSKTHLDLEFVKNEENRVTMAFLRLRELVAENVPIADYPLPDVIARRLSGSVAQDT